MLSEIEFYDRLAEFFDVMTDWQSRLALELPFLEATFARFNVKSVLDCACGTGGHALALAQRGYRVTGSDISAQMIARAQANAQRAGATVPFAVARFQDLRSTFNAQFDAVLCLGNSLPHVLTDAAALESLSSMRACLRSGGALILHNLNYDKRWKEKPRWFAVNSGMLDQRETLVWRFADYDETSGLVTFNVALFTKNENGLMRHHVEDSESGEDLSSPVMAHPWSVDVQSAPQRPYRQNEIELLLRRAGFREIAFYGSLQGEPFDADESADLVAAAVA